MPSKTKPTRSWLFTPGTRPDRFAKAAEIGADVLIIDLEGVVPPGGKPSRRWGRRLLPTGGSWCRCRATGASPC